LIVLPEVEPVVGALLLALEAVGVELTETIRENIATTLPRDLAIVRP